MSIEASPASARVIARGVAAASLAVVPAAAAHGIADGHAVEPGALALTILAASVVCVRLVGRRAGRIRIAAAVFASQLLFHLIFLIAHPGAFAGHAGSPGSGHHLRHSTDAAAAALAELGQTGSAAPAPEGGMISAHLGAAAVTVLAFWHGRAVCRRIMRTGRRVLAGFARLAAPAPGLSAVASITPLPGPIIVRWAAPLPTRSLRGPPPFSR